MVRWLICLFWRCVHFPVNRRQLDPREAASCGNSWRICLTKSQAGWGHDGSETKTWLHFFFLSFLCVFAVRHQTMSPPFHITPYVCALTVTQVLPRSETIQPTQTPQWLLVKVSTWFQLWFALIGRCTRPPFPLDTLNYSDTLDDINIFPLGCLSDDCFPIGTLMIFHSGAVYDCPPRTSRPRGCVQAPQRGDVTAMGGCVNH